MESGRLQSHHAPRDIRRNFKSHPSMDPTGKTEPGYILDNAGQPTTLERKLSAEKEEEDRIRRKRIKWCVFWSFLILTILIAVVAIVVVILYFLTCVFGNCPTGCYDCEYSETSSWKRYRGSDMYSGKKKHCGDSLEVQFSKNTFTVDSSADVSGGKENIDGTDTAPLINSHSEIIEGKSQNTFVLYWYMKQTVRNNETLKLVFSDNGDSYAGLGDLGASVFRKKGKEDHYTMWVDDDNPIYLPFYISRNQDASLCMFVDAGGAPMEVTIRGANTEWLIYKLDQVYFHMYSDKTPIKAMNKCMEKWRELYPSPDAYWTSDFVIGSLTTDEIKTARNTEGILGTHYILSPESVTVENGDMKIDNENSISDYDKVFLAWNAKQNLADSGFDLKSENGYFKTHQESVYYMDYDNDVVKSDISSAISGETLAGVILQNDFYREASRPTSNDCPRYQHCSPANSAFFNWESDLCLDDKFGKKSLFQKHNYYDSSRKSALQSASSMIVESVAAPGTTHFHRDLPLTAKGLKTCFHNLLNLQLIGIRAVSCNMCGGLIPQETDLEQSSVCDRLSQLAFLMPYVIMTNSETPPLITDTKDSGRYVKNNLNVRRQFRYYLDAAYRQALEENVPFVYTVGTRYNDDIYDQHQQGVMIGDKLFYAAVLDEPEEGEDTIIALPPGFWYSNGGPLTGEFYNGGQEKAQASTDMSNLIYFKAPNIFVLEDLEDLENRPNHVIVRVFLPYEVEEYQNTTSLTYDYYEPGSQDKHSVFIEFSAESGDSAEIKFTYTSPGSTVSQDIKISAIEVYLWYVNNDSPPSWVAFNARGDDKYNVVLDYIQRKTDLGSDTHSLFETWTQSFEF